MREVTTEADLSAYEYDSGYSGYGKGERKSAQLSQHTSAEVTVLGPQRKLLLTPDEVSDSDMTRDLTQDTLEAAKNGPITVFAGETFSNGWSLAQPTEATIKLQHTQEGSSYVAYVEEIGIVASGTTPLEAALGIGNGMVTRYESLRHMNGEMNPRQRPILQALEFKLVPPAEAQAVA